MRPQFLLVLDVGFLLAAGGVYAQTEGIQREVETRLWIQRALAWIEKGTGASPLVSILTLLIALAISLGLLAWLWKKRRKDPG
jgi:LPXTG-motif cell wall-anchored protein